MRKQRTLHAMFKIIRRNTVRHYSYDYWVFYHFSLATLSTDVKNVQEDVDQLDTRVTNTEENVVTIQNEVNEQKQDIEDIKEDVTKVEERVDNVENVVQETIEKVEEIDHKVRRRKSIPLM